MRKKKAKLDEDTAKVLTEAEELAEGVKGMFWGIVKKRFVEKITAINDVMNIDVTKPENLANQILANQKIVSVLIELIREIEGEAMTAKDYQQAFTQEKNSEYLQIINGED